MSVSVDARYLRRPGVGISRYLSGVIEQLVRSGTPVTLLTDGYDHRPELERLYPSATVRVLPRRSGLVWEQWSLPRYLRASGHAAHVAGANYGLPLASTGDVHTVLVVHDLIPLRMPRTYILPRPRWAVKYFVSQFVSLFRASSIVAVSRATARDVRRFALGRRALVRYPDWRTPLPSPLPDLPDGWPERFVVFNGGLDPRKNVAGLIDAFALYVDGGGDHDLVLMGSGAELYSPRIEGLGIADRVHLAGWVDEGVKYTAIERAGAVVYPSTLEGFGLPVVESLRLGTPVVTGTGGSLREVGGQTAVYVDVTDPHSIAHGIERAVRREAREHVRIHAGAHLERLAAPAAPEADPVVAAVGSPA